VIRFAANVSLLFPEFPFLDRFAAARDAGFTAVEIQFPYDHPAGTVARAATRAGTPIVLINAPMGIVGSPGIACRPELRGPFLRSIEQASAYASELGVVNVNVLAGTSQAADRDASLTCLIEHLLLAADALERVGSKPLLEAINPHDLPDYCVRDYSTAAAVLDATRGRAALQFDIYHAARMGLNPIDAYLGVRDRVGHIQFADSPGRNEPGTGTLDLPAIFRAIDASGYSGWIGAEYHPLAASGADVNWLQRTGL
jgi:hydroxypyruvate isomerase